jgi:hypothetical protein
MRLFLLFLVSLFAVSPSVSLAQVPDIVEEVSQNKFRSALLKAAQASAKSGELKRLDVIRLRVATLSPAFLKQAQELAVIQMSFSGEDVPTDADGKIEVNRIDWEKLLEFLERLIPLLLKLMDLFAFSGGVYHDVA